MSKDSTEFQELKVSLEGKLSQNFPDLHFCLLLKQVQQEQLRKKLFKKIFIPPPIPGRREGKNIHAPQSFLVLAKQLLYIQDIFKPSKVLGYLY